MTTPARTLTTCTVRIEARRGGQPISWGTGFFYSYVVASPSPDRPGGLVSPVIVTNKHVVDGADRIQLQLSVSRAPTDLDSFGVPRDRHNFTCELDITEGVARHPAAEIDLCAIPIGPVVEDLISNRGFHVWHAFLHRDLCIPEAERSEVRAIEPVAMVGYPIGIWDSVNNVPLVRQGTTATHPFVRYEGRPEFVIDAACFGGSSGSPVFLYQDGLFRNRGGEMTPGTRIQLIGVLYGGPQYAASGRLEVRPIPHAVPTTPVPVTSIPTNLGYVIHADEIENLRPAMGLPPAI